MNGRRLRNKIIAPALVLLMWIMPVCVFATDGSPPPRIAILLSDDEMAYTKPVAVFIDDIKMPVEVFNLGGMVDNAPDQMAKIFSFRPALIFALGAKAAYTAKVWTADRPEVPVLFAMVLNWHRYGLLDGQDNIAGISSEVAPGTQFVNLTMASPKIKRIGVIYSEEHSSETLEQAKSAAQKLGLEVVAASIRRPKQFRRAYKKISKEIDGFWMLADPVVYTLDNVDWLRERCTKDRIVCVGESKNIAEVGILLAVNPDLSNIGVQAASIARNIVLRNQHPRQVGVMPPLGTHLVLNTKTAERIGLMLNRTVVDLASEVVGN